MGNRTFEQSVREKLLDQLAEGKSLLEICRDESMPDARTIYRWANGDDEFAQQLREAREVGFHLETDRLLEEVRACKDPQQARVISDTVRWRLGKLSNAFRDRPLVGVAVNVGSGDAFAAFADALEEARASRASFADSTREVALPSPSGPGDAGRGVADLAGPGGARLGEDADRS